MGFYFLLLPLMYVKRARINIPKRNIIVNASFTSMASPPFEGKPHPPKIQLYLHFTCISFSAQVFLFTCFSVLFSLSYNLQHGSPVLPPFYNSINPLLSLLFPSGFHQTSIKKQKRQPSNGVTVPMFSVAHIVKYFK
ncbi:hypothetical protein D3C85_1078020 [compost metagenome]